MRYNRVMRAIGNRGVNTCRGCGSSELGEILDLGCSPIANSLPPMGSELNEKSYPLVLRLCNSCGLGQIGEFESPDEIFSVYPYLSRTSATWIDHGRQFSEDIIRDFPEISSGYVLEIASNDGYLLQHFMTKNIAVLGVEPAVNVAAIAQGHGIPTISEFFGVDLARKILEIYGQPSLIIANNVAAHVPDMLDFFSGLSLLCSPSTLISIENPSLGYLIEKGYYDTIYHEHFSYLSIKPIRKLAERVELDLFRVDNLETHGGSLRYLLCKKNTLESEESVRLNQSLEILRGVDEPVLIERFAENVKNSVNELRTWVSSQNDNSIIGFGAAAKTVTTFHAADLNQEKFRFIVDSNILKQGRRLPGTNLEICSPELIKGGSPLVLIFPWNIQDELFSVVRTLNPNAQVWVHSPVTLLNKIKA